MILYYVFENKTQPGGYYVNKDIPPTDDNMGFYISIERDAAHQFVRDIPDGNKWRVICIDDEQMTKLLEEMFENGVKYLVIVRGTKFPSPGELVIEANHRPLVELLEGSSVASDGQHRWSAK